ncbi:MAG: hypothetical protein VB121_12970 [Enterococcus thailandicus]|nr:hypothetical protein [Enterococcus thailandicus]
MQDLPQASWENIYGHWKLCATSGPAVFNAPINPVEIHVDLRDENTIFYGYDWLTRSELYKRKEIIEKNPSEFLYFTQPTNKGTIHTLSMLMEAKDEEESAAIWIYAFAKELADTNVGGNIGRYAYQLCDASRDFLSNHYYLWHHAMKKLVPELFINYNIYLETQFHSIEAIIELARLNAALVLYEYVPILYSSLKPGERRANYTVRLETANS